MKSIFERVRSFVFNCQSFLKDFFLLPLGVNESRVLVIVIMCTFLATYYVQSNARYLAFSVDDNINAKLDIIMKKMEIDGSICPTSSEYFWNMHWNPDLYGTDLRFKESESFVGQIVINGKSKSGGSASLFLYKGKVVIATTLHVIDDALVPDNKITLRYRNIFVDVPSGAFISDHSNDLSMAIVNMYIKTEDLPKIKIATDDDIKLEDEVLGYGYPHFFFAFSTGKIKRISYRDIDTDGKIYYGFSGGPMVKIIEGKYLLVGIIKELKQSNCTGIVAIHPRIITRLADKLVK